MKDLEKKHKYCSRTITGQIAWCVCKRIKKKNSPYDQVEAFIRGE